ncbi:MAG TPA: EscU/YscU/HrcU family type III secretion system export apparatus switch protein [Spirochaetota bacterium]|jgi:flagellar biosynthesis protein|nr:MAG: flagellar biosynthesis protein FlhB [Spirochaetes bacterium ADurb.Bin133]HNZ26602.1 EscU/YscU/HrcU family type III secretion system export apparatus switch protein [Spirochaetota bacterium]HOF00668.1 EscU/YscU/HrcU family type III secretion system export apparatus switch protein [Spirochaetota bacterium]HOS32367.1 EscU/YscU/HrcU family type III secretion system export apparatus switch protein [Spirochaetota bacterium]HOS55614.1 EscU/YscU/HrcU family type III secretion system export appa
MIKKSRKKAAAITYLKENLDIPIISALGSDELADKIIEKAKENGIKIFENKEFFQYEKLFDIGNEIPPEIYKIVAEILVFIIKSNDE